MLERTITSILLWIYWTAILAVVLCALPIILCFAVLYSEE